MSAMQPMASQPEPNEKTIKVHFSSKLSLSADAAVVTFPRFLSVEQSEFRIKDGLTATLRIPTRLFKLYIDTFFPGDTSALRVTAAITGANLEALSIAQNDNQHVLIDVKHINSTTAEYCTVTCEATNESRSGIGACIDCKGRKGVVRLCC
jgi:hypothetical protein